MSDTQAEMLLEIEKIRARNNKLWMGLVRIALASSSETVTLLMDEIGRNDIQVSGLWEKLKKSREPG